MITFILNNKTISTSEHSGITLLDFVRYKESIKQEIKDVMVDIESFDIADTNTDFTKYIIFNEIFNQLLNPLTQKQREVIKLKYLEGLTVAEIANVMGCSHQNVSSVCKSAEKTILKGVNSGELSFV